MRDYRGWGGSARIGSLYIVTTDYDLQRVGNCFMQGRLRRGDVLLCTQHSGDCFYDYQLVRVYANAIAVEPGGKFGAYQLGQPLDWLPNERQAHLLMAGEHVHTEAVFKEAQAWADKHDAQRQREVLDLRAGDVVTLSYHDQHRDVVAVVVANDLADKAKSSLLLNVRLRDSLRQVRCSELRLGKDDALHLVTPL